MPSPGSTTSIAVVTVNVAIGLPPGEATEGAWRTSRARPRLHPPRVKRQAMDLAHGASVPCPLGGEVAADRLAQQAVPGCFRGSPGRVLLVFPITRLDEAGMLLREDHVNTDWLEKVRARAHAIWERLGRPEGAAERTLDAGRR